MKKELSEGLSYNNRQNIISAYNIIECIQVQSEDQSKKILLLNIVNNINNSNEDVIERFLNFFNTINEQGKINFKKNLYIEQLISDMIFTNCVDDIVGVCSKDFQNIENLSLKLEEFISDYRMNNVVHPI